MTVNINFKKISRRLDLNVFGKTASDISSGVVFADKEFGRGVSEDTSASLDGAADLSCTLPHDLSKVRELRVGRVVLRGFVCPQLDGTGNIHVSACRQILSKRAEGASRMFELAIVRPLLCSSSQRITPSQVGCPVIPAN